MEHLQKDNVLYYANMLNFMESWKQQGVWNCYASPCYTYVGTGNASQKYWPGLMDEQGRCYYNSFPPLSFIATYCWVQCFSISQPSLMWLNFVLQFLCALFLFLICSTMFSSRQRYGWALLATLVFISLPIVQFFFTDYYFIENMALLFLFVATWAAVKYVITPSRIHLVLLLVSTFLLTYSEAIGILFTFVTGLIIYMNQKDFKIPLLLLFVTGLAITLMMMQYSQIAGYEAVLKNYAIRFAGRSGYFGNSLTENSASVISWKLYSKLAENIWLGYGLLIGFFALVVAFSIRTIQQSFKISESKGLIYLVVMPVLLHTIIFLNANAFHMQLLVKLSLPILITIFYFIDQKSNKNDEFRLGALAMTMLILTSLINSFQLNYSPAMVSPQFFTQAEQLSKKVSGNEKIILVVNENQTQNLADYIPLYNFAFKHNVVALTEKQFRDQFIYGGYKNTWMMEMEGPYEFIGLGKIEELGD